jgi:hypothetical protein
MFNIVIIISNIIILFYLINIILKNKNIEKFTGFLELISSINTDKNIDSKNDLNNITNIPNIPKNTKKETKYIYLKKMKDNKYLYKYIFFNKNYDKYMIMMENNKNYKKEIMFFDIKNNRIGESILQIYNKIIINISFFDHNMNIEYFNNFKSIKIYLDNDDKIFYINKKDDYYTINLFTLNIGKIDYDIDDNYYRIIIYSDYKKYLNMFGIGFILMLHN